MRAVSLINEICNVLDLPITEQVIGKKWYLFLPDRLEDMTSSFLASSDLTSKRFDPETSHYLVVFSEPHYVSYKQNLAKFSSAGNRQYIYSFDRPLNIFVPTEGDIKKLFSIGALVPESVKKFYGWAGKDFSDESLPGRIANLIKFGQWKSDSPLRATGKNWEKARAVFDGFMSLGSERTHIYLDVILKHTKLIDGNAIRFPSRGSVLNDLPFPKEKYDEWQTLIVPALMNYTRHYGQQLDAPVKEWLRENFQKPYDRVIVYRAFRLKFDKSKDLGENIRFYLSKLRRFTGLTSFEDCQVGREITLTRNKESSWSTSPVISTAFSSAAREGSINFLVKAEIPSDRVLIDFNVLPIAEKKIFKHWGQNEVVVDVYDIPAVINKMWIDEPFKQWLQAHGYQFVVQKGIFKQ